MMPEVRGQSSPDMGVGILWKVVSATERKKVAIRNYVSQIFTLITQNYDLTLPVRELRETDHFLVTWKQVTQFLANVNKLSSYFWS